MVERVIKLDYFFFVGDIGRKVRFNIIDGIFVLGGSWVSLFFGIFFNF